MESKTTAPNAAIQLGTLPGVRGMRERCLLRKLKGREGARILDVGCQSGHISAHLCELGFVPSGTDISKTHIDRARANYPHIPFFSPTEDGKLPVSHGSFDIVWAGDVIEHVYDIDMFLREINRILKMGGKLFLSTPSHTKAKNLLIALFRFDKHFDVEWGHIRFFSPKSIRTSLERRGFCVHGINYFGGFPFLHKSMFVEATKCRELEDHKTQ
ncbi:MAG: class I SAM-dependent methyltransferase [Candidatus Sumerlaeota bacterium]|nr:class I SAM-dependent methyltransferase [Candidatus Sumerlaeota bacterium]